MGRHGPFLLMMPSGVLSGKIDPATAQIPLNLDCDLNE